MTPIVVYLDSFEGIAAVLGGLACFCYAVCSALDSMRRKK